MPVVTETTDAATGTSTAYSMAVGDYFYGNLSLDDDDWVAVTLQAGQTYTFGLTGMGAPDDGVSDTVVRLFNTASSLIDSDDQSGPGNFSNLTYTATQTGTYYLSAKAWQPFADSGDYSLSVTLGTRASYDVAMGAGVLLRPDASWAATPDTGVTVTWGIRASGPGPGGGTYDAQGDPTPYITPSAAQIAATQDVLSMFGGISGLNFSQVNPGGTTNNATVLVGAYSSSSDGAGAFAYYPGSTAASANAGDVWLNNNSVSQSSLPTGSFSHFAMLHEVGHAVGLAHPGDYNAAPGVSITYGANAQFIEDSHQYTVMSYFDESNTTTSFFSYPDTLLLYDIYALHQLYGADFSYHAGNTTYGFNATVGRAYDFTINTTPVLSIWDGSGTDTLDLSGYGMAQTINLGEGMFSDIGGFSGNVSIAVGAVIENAIGGSGADSITGNSVNNGLLGGSGNDTLAGNAGNDALFGGNNDDVLLGGGNNDRLYGQAGQDSLVGDSGNDTMIGGGDSDTLKGGVGDDSLEGGGGSDELFGGADNDTLFGGDGNDAMFGEGGSDELYSDAGRDILRGQAGNDLLYGGADADVLLGGGNNDYLDGEGGNDILYGQAGNDVMYGGANDDILRGQIGLDTLVGDSGNDTLIGGGHSDIFVFSNGFGTDQINDFNEFNNNEKIDLSGVTAITSFADLTNPGGPHMIQVGADVVIDDGLGNTITVLNVGIGDMNEADFVF